MKKAKLVEKVYLSLKEDIEVNKDYTVLYELLRYIPKKNLKAALPEQ